MNLFTELRSRIRSKSHGTPRTATPVKQPRATRTKDLTKAQKYAQRHPRKAAGISTHPLRGLQSKHDVRCMSLMGMDLSSIRRHYGREAAKHVTLKMKAAA
jgi:hypothetical protein